MFRPRVTSHIYGGHRFTVHIEDHIAAAWYDHDWDEPAEIALLSSGKLQTDALVFDLGAHQSVVAMMLSKQCRQVVAVEADQACVNVSRHNLNSNGIKNVELVHAAVAAKPGVLIFANSNHVGRGESGEAVQEVVSITVDQLAEQYGTCTVLFIDVEGYECEVLAGATETLKSRPDLFIEAHVKVGLEDFGGSIERLLSMIPKGYRILVSPPEERSFVPLEMGAEVLKRRCFIVALS